MHAVTLQLEEQVKFVKFYEGDAFVFRDACYKFSTL